RCAIIPEYKLRHAKALGVRLELICANAAIEDLGLLVDFQDLLLIELFQDVAHAQDNDLVTDDGNAPVAIMEIDRVEHGSQTQDLVGPTLPSGRPVIEFAEARA